MCVDEHSQALVSDSTILFQVAPRMLGRNPPEGGGVASPWTARWTCARSSRAASGDHTGRAAQGEMKVSLSQKCSVDSVPNL